ncbi:MAG: T9SS type A sorting domain-containing protein [Bacteroidia bacterium]|jgi:hypothetical protein
MKKHLLIGLAVLFFAIGQTKAQTIDFVFTVTNASSDTACDGEIDVQCVGCLTVPTYTWYDTSGTNNIIGTGNHIVGLCKTNNLLYIATITYPGSACMVGCSIKNASSAGASFQLKTSLKAAPDNYDPNYFLNTFVKIVQTSGGTGPYWYKLFDSDGFTSYNSTLLKSDSNLTTMSNVVFDSLNDGYLENFSIIVGDFSQNYIEYAFSMIYDTTSCNQCPIPLFASAQGFPVSDSTTCDGTAYVEVYGGTPPYTYQFSSGSTDSTASGLCSGSYIVTVTDAASNTYSTTFVIGYPGTYYYTGGNYNYLDTLYSNAMQDCGIDYSIPIDSFYIDSSYALSNWEYVVNWTIIQDTNQFAFTETYFIDSTGYYMFGISLYCDARSSTFGSYTFFAGAMADMSQTPAGIKDATANNSVSVYPNPSNGLFNLKASSKIESYTVYDQLGRMVSTEHLITDNQIVNMSKMPDGMYYLTVRFKDGTTSRQKILKK